MISRSPDSVQISDTRFLGCYSSKGASTLRQLLALITEKNFSSALHKYFKKFAFKNATLDDLINIFDEECKVSEENISQ